MITIFPVDHTQHAPPHEFLNGALIASHESPARAAIIHAALREAGLGPIELPRAFGLAPLRAVHTDDYLEYLEHAYQRWVDAGGAPAAVMPDTLAVRWMGRRSDSPLALPGYYTSDLGAPIVAGTYRAARDSADAALTAADLLLQGQPAAYALCRPPGHHAGSDLCGGYCFLNNAAIAAAYLLGGGTPTTGHRPPATIAEGAARTAVTGRQTTAESSTDQPSLDAQDDSDLGEREQLSADVHRPPARVAILDIDYHHGNGTQQIFYRRADVLTVSLHADPAREYPYFAGYAEEQGEGAGAGYNLNLPLEAGVGDERYLAALEGALEAIAVYAPQFLVVSAGFDTFGGDPIGDFAMTSAAYPQVGRRIAALGLSTLFVQEGGYAVDALGVNAVGLLRGFVEGAS